MNKKVGEKIRQARLAINLSQDNVAEEIGMSPGNYGKIERGEIEVGSGHLIKIAKALKVNVGDFFDDKTKANLRDNEHGYGYASKDDLSEANSRLDKLNTRLDKQDKEIQELKEQLSAKKAVKKKSARK